MTLQTYIMAFMITGSLVGSDWFLWEGRGGDEGGRRGERGNRAG